MFFFALGSKAFAQEREEKVADAKFWVVNGFFAGSVVHDVESTFYALDKCGGRCYELNLFQRYFVLKGRLPTYSVQAAVGLPVVYSSYYLKKRGSKLWWVIPVTVGAVHTAAGTWNIKIATRF